MPAVRQKLHLSSCPDFRDRLSSLIDAEKLFNRDHFRGSYCGLSKAVFVETDAERDRYEFLVSSARFARVKFLCQRLTRSVNVMPIQNGSLRIRMLEDSEAATWDAFVRSSPQGTIFSLTCYLDAFEISRKVMIAEQDGHIQGGIVLARNSLGFATNPFHAKYLGLLFANFGDHQETKNSKCRRVAGLFAERLRRITSFDYAFEPGFTDWLPFYWEGFHQQTRYTYRIHPTSGKRWQDNAEHRVRKAIRRSTRAGVEVDREGTVSELVSIVATTFRRQGAPTPISEARLTAILTKLTNFGVFKIYVARKKGGAPAAAVGVAVDPKLSTRSFRAIMMIRHPAPITWSPHVPLMTPW